MVHSNNEDEISEALQEAKEALQEIQDFKKELLEHIKNNPTIH